MRTTTRITIAGIATTLLVSIAQAQQPAAPPNGAPRGPANLTVDALAAGKQPSLTVTVSGLGPDKLLDDKYTNKGQALSPPVSWTAGPRGTQSYLLVMQDVIENRGYVFNHWVMYNIPANVTSLPEAIPAGSNVASIPGAVQIEGRDQGYGAPGRRANAAPPGGAPPAGAPPGAGAPPAGAAPAAMATGPLWRNEYHVQVLALDTKINNAKTYDEVAAQATGHVLGYGKEIVGIMTNSVPAPAPGAPPAAPPAR